MSKEKRRVPKLRFPGFTEDWEQRKLGDIATFSKGNGYSKSDLAPSGVPIILYGRLYTNYETTISNIDTFVELKDKSIISQGGEVIVPASGETAEDISRASVVKKQGIIIGGDLNVIKANHLLDPTFLALTISNGEQQKELSKRAQGKSVVHLNNSDLQEVNLTFPVLNEQKEISTLFEKMDNFITLHQRKLEHLNLKKKALLQKLFPKNGGRYPELRFPGFTDAWEQRELSSLTKYIGTGKSRFVIKEFGEYAILGSTNVIGYDDAYDYDGNFILTARVGANAGQLYRYSGKVKITDNTVFLMSDRSQFIYYALTHFDLRRLSFGTGQPLVKSSELQKLKLCVPVSKSEQEKIGEIFNNIDNIITLHQRKLDHLQLQKKALLQQMFV